MGTSDIVGNTDYNEFSGNATNAGKLPGGRKISGLKVNDVVYKNCCEFFKELRSLLNSMNFKAHKLILPIFNHTLTV